jgi:DUF4097 and DUF4098 domain-containing protein YvlB
MRLLSIIAICLLGLTVLEAAEYEFPADYKTPAGDIQKIVVDCPQGSIRFEQSLNTDIDIRVLRVIHLESPSKSEKVANEIKVNFRKDGQTLYAIVDVPSRNGRARDILGNIFSGDFSNDIEILIKVSTPANLMLSVATSSADVIGSDIRNDLTVKGSSTDINLENVTGNCDLRVTSGDLSGHYIEGNISFLGSSSDIDVEELKGNLEVETSSGDVAVRKVKGNVKAESTSGELQVDDIEGDIDLDATSGDVYCQNIEGSAQVSSISGDIKLSGLTNPTGIFRAASTSGDVYLEIARSFNGHLEIETSSGEINADIDMDYKTISDSYLEGKTGEGTGKIKIVTTSGDVSLNEM